jgi:hypothetical protein
LERLNGSVSATLYKVFRPALVNFTSQIRERIGGGDVAVLGGAFKQAAV